MLNTKFVTCACAIILAYSMLGGGNPDARVVGMPLEVISGASVIGIAVIMYPFLKPFTERVSRLYIILISIEGSFMIITGSLFLSQNPQLLAIRDAIWLGHAYVFIAGANF